MAEPGRRLFVSASRSQAERLERAALMAGNETGKSIPATELHRRLLPALLACADTCANCRAGTCDGSVHVRKDNPVGLKVCPNEPTEEVSIQKTAEQTMVPKSVEKNTTAVEQVDLCAQVSAPPTAKKAKAPRKPKVVDENSPERVRLIDEFHLAYIAARGTKPPHTKRDWKAFDELLAAIGYDQASECIRNAFTDPFWAPKVTIRDIVANPSKFAGAAKALESKPSAIQGGKDELSW